LDELVAFAGDADDLAVAEIVVAALSRKALLLRELGRREAELEVWDDLLARYRRDAPTGSAVAVIGVLAGRAYALLVRGRWQQVVAACDELLALAADVSDEQARQREAWALKTKADALIELKQYEAAIGELDLLVERFGSSVDECAGVCRGRSRTAGHRVSPAGSDGSGARGVGGAQAAVRELDGSRCGEGRVVSALQPRDLSGASG
jgi:tetratricopeptide (TPR) repeat protein